MKPRQFDILSKISKDIKTGNYANRIVYEVNMNKVVGTLGGSQGDGGPLSKILFILAKEDGVITNRIINAYPY